MNQTKHGVHHDHRPYWKRAHRDWRFVIAVVLMLGGMFLYLVSGDLEWGPREKVPAPDAAGK
jgi:hypothetical protein